jgi:hypothetical protein
VREVRRILLEHAKELDARYQVIQRVGAEAPAKAGP